MRNKQEMSLNSDSLDSLPTDKNAPSHAEIQIVDSLFKQQHTMIQKILVESKDVILVGILFILFSFPQIDELIIKYVPSTENSIYILVFTKALLFMACYFLIKNMYLVRK